MRAIRALLRASGLADPGLRQQQPACAPVVEPSHIDSSPLEHVIPRAAVFGRIVQRSSHAYYHSLIENIPKIVLVRRWIDARAALLLSPACMPRSRPPGPILGPIDRSIRRTDSLRTSLSAICCAHGPTDLAHNNGWPSLTLARAQEHPQPTAPLFLIDELFFGTWAVRASATPWDTRGRSRARISRAWAGACFAPCGRGGFRSPPRAFALLDTAWHCCVRSDCEIGACARETCCDVSRRTLAPPLQPLAAQCCSATHWWHSASSLTRSSPATTPASSLRSVSCGRHLPRCTACAIASDAGYSLAAASSLAAYHSTPTADGADARDRYGLSSPSWRVPRVSRRLPSRRSAR